MKIDGIIFDVDGVLIDTRTSFLEAVRNSVEYVLEKQNGKKIKVDDKDIEALRAVEGFNNDWDLTFTLIDLFKKGVKRNNFKSKAKKLTKEDRKNPEYQKVQSIDETFYWGDKLYFKKRKKKPPFARFYGFVENESLLIKKPVLDLLKKNFTLGIATGRNRFEMFYSIKKWKLCPFYFKRKNVVTDDDTFESKPSPAPLLEAKKRMGVKNPIYVGDTINDVIAAKSAKMKCVFVGSKKLGDWQIENINNLEEVLNNA